VNPYQTLGVPNDAPPAAIKQAYRKAAKQAHPDKGGSDDAMHAVNRAWLVLSDPKRRERYDKTGKIEEKDLSNPDTRSWEVITFALDKLIEDDVALSVNIKTKVTEMLSEILAKIDQGLDKAKRKKAKAENIAARFKRKKKAEGLDMMLQVLSFKQRKEQEVIDKLEVEKATMTRAIELLKDYDFTADKVSSQVARSQQVWFGNTTTGNY
jgi:curved DNA-binding protein CbpA